MADTRISFLWRKVSRKLWLRVSFFALAGMAVAGLAPVLGPFLPDWLAGLKAAESVEGILNILASSMLAVTTFSLSITVGAYAAASASVTPRAVTLLKEDTTSQLVLSTFLGAFLFALVGLIGVRAGVFAASGQVVLFGATLWVIGAVVLALLRWISHLSSFGRVSDTIGRVEDAALRAMCERVAEPYLGGVAPVRHPAGLVAVCADQTGYLCHIDMPGLQKLAEGLTEDPIGPVLHVDCLPGAFVHRKTPLLYVPACSLDADAGKPLAKALRRAFTVGTARTFDQDPRFGLSVLSEIAERALSPAVNDPGTALDVLSRLMRVIEVWADRATVAPSYPLVAVPGMAIDDLFEDAFAAISRDGAGVFSVQLRLQKLLLALVQIAPDSFGAAAVALSKRALQDATRGLTHASDLERIRDVVDAVHAAAEDRQHGPRMV
ncbi:MAG: DUF2254 domain-containing protein [Rhodobacteraceae bacterium]|nr:DUF2254 domain-containing protein [Paracoccaceae bacterium]